MKDIHVGAYANVLDEKGNIWLSDCQHNALFKYSIETKKITFVNRFPEIDILSADNHSDMKIIDNTIIFIPIKMKYIFYYFINEDRFSKIVIPDYSEDTSYSGAIVIENKVYFSSLSGKLYSIDIDEQKVEMIKDLRGVFDCGFEKDVVSIYKVTGYDKGFAYFSSESKELCLFDIYGNKSHLLDMKGMNSMIHTVSKIEDKLYFTFKKTACIWEYDIKSGSKNIYQKKQENNETIPFQGVVDIEETIIVLNMYSEDLCYLNKYKKEIIKVDELGSTSGWARKDRLYGPMFNNVIKVDNYYIFMPCRSKKMLIYNSKSKEYLTHQFSIEIDQYSEYKHVIWEYYKRHNSITEGTMEIDLKSFIECITKKGVRNVLE